MRNRQSRSPVLRQRRQASARPRALCRGAYRSRAYRAAIDRALTHATYDRIVCDFLVPAINLPRQLPAPGHNDARPGGELRLWDVATGRELATPLGASTSSSFWRSAPMAIASSCPAGRGFGESSEAQVWDVATGRTLFPLRGHTGNVQGVAFSPDGTPDRLGQPGPDGQALGRGDQAARSSPSAATPPASSPGLQPGWPPPRLGQHRLDGPRLGLRGCWTMSHGHSRTDPARSAPEPWRGTGTIRRAEPAPRAMERRLIGGEVPVK